MERYLEGSQESPIYRPDLAKLVDVNWDDVSAVSSICLPYLDLIASDYDLMINAMEHTLRSPELFERCESNYFFDRIVLFENTSSSYSVRLHFIRPADYDRPHNHRATIAIRLLAGGYIHSMYELPEGIEHPENECLIDKEFILSLKPFFTRKDGPGDSFVLNHKAFHSTLIETDHASLMIRGPSMKDYNLFMDQRDGTLIKNLGGKFETKQALCEKKMTEGTMQRLIDRMRKYSRSA